MQSPPVVEREPQEAQPHRLEVELQAQKAVGNLPETPCHREMRCRYPAGLALNLTVAQGKRQFCVLASDRCWTGLLAPLSSATLNG